jgi:nucleotide-binding universal stress UspA family protein
VLFRSGLPVHVLLDRAEGARMLVLGSRLAGNRRPEGPTVPLGPVVRDCLRGAPCPVVVPPVTRNPRALSPAW